MKLGVFSFNTEYSIRADELAIACEERGFDSVWFPEHTHIPASRETEWPAGGELPKEYVHMSDPFATAAAAAAVTSTIKIGTGICLVIQHDPIALAKTVAMPWLLGQQLTLLKPKASRQSRLSRPGQKALSGT